jgi:hypothetical protein
MRNAFIRALCVIRDLDSGRALTLGRQREEGDYWSRNFEASKIMTPQNFVLGLKAHVAKSAASEVDYFRNPPSRNPPEHLKKFSQWFGRLSEEDKNMVGELVRYAKEGELFSILTYFDNLAHLTREGGKFELFHLDEKGKRIRLNKPDGELLTDIFNNEG